MSKLWIIARKDIREALRSRSTYLFFGIMVVISLTQLGTFNRVINLLIEQNASQQLIHQSTFTFLNSLAYILPLMFSILVCSIFAAYAVITEKAKRNLESLMVTPLSLNQIWMAKTLAVTLPSVVIGLVVSALAYGIITVYAVVPKTGGVIMPDLLAIVSAFILVPILIFAVVSIVIYLQLIISNPRIANLVFTGIFMIVFFGINLLTGIGININFSLIYLGLIVLCGAISYLLSGSLTKEKVLLSSKG
jgi:ABC-type Na+ efflux pump permease subunit